MENLHEEKRIEVGEEALNYLNTTRKWTMFFAVLGFVVTGLMLLGCIVAGVLFRSFTGLSGMEGMEELESTGFVAGAAEILLIVFIIIIALIYFFPLYYLLRFSQHTRKAIKTLSGEELTKAFRNLKSYWLYIGVLVIIVFSVNLIIFVIAGTSLAFLSKLTG